MKKLFIFAALAFGLAACETKNEESIDAVVNGDKAVEFTINVIAPEIDETRVADSGYRNSELGGLQNGVLGLTTDNVTLRYILDIYDANGVRSEQRYYAYSDAKNVEFTPRLIPKRKYTFVVWADIVDTKAAEGNYVDKHYNTADLTKVTLKDTWTPMDETRDAFSGFEVVESLSSAEITVNLTRPFGKLRIVTTDKKAVNDLHVTPDYASVDYTAIPVYSFNAKDGSYTALTPATLSKSHAKFAIANYSASNAGAGEMTLFTDYFFAPSTEEVALGVFTLNVYDTEDENSLITSTTFSSSIPVKRNRLTTIKGNLLTIQGGDFKIKAVANDAFAEGETIVNFQ